MQIKSGRNILIGIVLLTSIILTTIVYAAFNTQLNIEGEAIVRSDQDIRITNISISNRTNGAYETYNNKYNKDTTFMYVTLPANSSITYEIEITNKVSDSYLIDSITQQSHTNQNVNVDISLNQNDVVNANSTKTFTITLTNNTSSEQQETLVYKYEFKLNNFTVTFDANGGSVSQTSKEVSYGSPYGQLPTPTREGYTFKGWNGKNMFITRQNSFSILANTSTSQGVYIYSKRPYIQEGIKYYISYTIDNDSSSNTRSTPMLDISGNYHYQAGTVNNNLQSGRKVWEFTPTLSGLGALYYWLVDSDVDVSVSNFMISTSSNIEYEPYYIEDTTTVVQAQNHTLTAIWEPNTYQIVFDKNANDATGTMSNQNMTYDESTTLSSNAFTRTGYIFGGWNTESDGSGTSYTNEQSVSKLATSGTKTLYAQWKKAYTITNLVQNGSFEDGLNNWNKTSYVDSTINYHNISNDYKKYGNSSLERLTSTTRGRNYISQNISFNINHKYYTYLYGYANSSTSQIIIFDISGATNYIQFNLSVNSETGWKKGSFIYNSAATENRNLAVNWGATSDNTYVDGVGIVDLTDVFGSGNEPSKEWCDNNIEYFDGTTTVYK